MMLLDLVNVLDVGDLDEPQCDKIQSLSLIMALLEDSFREQLDTREIGRLYSQGFPEIAYLLFGLSFQTGDAYDSDAGRSLRGRPSRAAYGDA